MWKTLLFMGLMASVACVGKQGGDLEVRESGHIVFTEIEQSPAVRILLSSRTDFECSGKRSDETLCWTTAGVRHCMDGLDGMLAIVDTGVSSLGERTMSWEPNACFDEASPRMRLIFAPPVSSFQVSMRLHPIAANDRVTLICWGDLADAMSDAWGTNWSPRSPQGPAAIVGVRIGSSPPIEVCDFLDAEVDNIIPKTWCWPCSDDVYD